MNSNSVSINENGQVKKKKKFDINKMPQIPWSEDRPRPELTPGVWDDQSTYELWGYIDWHRRHPHCVTPRLADAESKSKLSGAQLVDEENPNLIYSKNGVKKTHLPPEFKPTRLGVDCDTDEVSTIAMSTERNKILNYITEFDDPWYQMSVKDQLEQSHIDGSHTTVKTKRKKKPVMTAFQRERAFQIEQYGNYEGGYPSVSKNHAKELEELALKDKFELHDVKKGKKVGPWYNEYVFSKYTAQGTALDAYNQHHLTKSVNDALALYESEVKQDSELALRKSSKSNKSFRVSVKQGDKMSPTNRSSKRSAKVVPIVEDPDVVMRRKLGDDKKIEKMTKNWIKMAIKVTKKAKINKNIINTTMDLVEACEKLRVVKVNAMLASGEGKAIMKTPDDEPLFVYMFNKAIINDNLTNNLHPAPAQTASDMLGLSGTIGQAETSDRKKMTKILSALLNYGANVNVCNRDGMDALHMAAKNDNSKMVIWCLNQKGIEISKVSKIEQMTALMIAAKYGNVRCLAELVKHGAKLDEVNMYGRTALHYAGLFGQSRPAQFLLRVGASKKIRDKDGKLAAELATENGFPSTAQLISAYAFLTTGEATAQLKYIMKVEVLGQEAPRPLSSYMTDVFKFSNLKGGIKSCGSIVKKAFHKLILEVRKVLGYDDDEPVDELEMAAELLEETREIGEELKLPEQDEDGEEEEMKEGDESGEEGAAGDHPPMREPDDNHASDKFRNHFKHNHHNAHRYPNYEPSMDEVVPFEDEEEDFFG